MAKIRIMILSCFLFLFHCHKETQGEKNDRVFKENRPWLLYVMLRPYIYGDYCEGVLRKNADEVAVFGKEYTFTGRKNLLIYYPETGIKITVKNVSSDCEMGYGYNLGCNIGITYTQLSGSCPGGGGLSLKNSGPVICTISDNRISTLSFSMVDGVSGTNCIGYIKVEKL